MDTTETVAGWGDGEAAPGWRGAVVSLAIDPFRVTNITICVTGTCCSYGTELELLQ